MPQFTAYQGALSKKPENRYTGVMEQSSCADKALAPGMKEAAGRAAVDDLVKSGMKLGLGTGSTAIHAIRRVVWALVLP
jgi:hypothetical protein